MKGERFETTEYGEICSDINKESVKSFDECKKATKELFPLPPPNHTYIPEEGNHNSSSIPKGCVVHGWGERRVVVWNLPEIGERNNRTQEICRNGS